jgi:hypothetical protein
MPEKIGDLETTALRNYLNSFGRQVTNRAKGQLQRKKGGTDLEKTIKYSITKQGKSYVVNFFMADYGAYLDKGVSGNKEVQSYKSYEGKNLTSPYKYTTKQPPPDILAKWISKKNIKGRDKATGRFISNTSLAYLIGRKIKRDGFKSLAFFQKPLQLGLKQFGSKILDVLSDEIIKNVKDEEQKINKTQVA